MKSLILAISIGILVAALFLAGPTSLLEQIRAFAQEDYLEYITYYPSPWGEYKTMRIGNASIPGTLNIMAPTTYPPPNPNVNIAALTVGDPVLDGTNFKGYNGSITLNGPVVVGDVNYSGQASSDTLLNDAGMLVYGPITISDGSLAEGVMGFEHGGVTPINFDLLGYLYSPTSTSLTGLLGTSRMAGYANNITFDDLDTGANASGLFNYLVSNSGATSIKDGGAVRGVFNYMEAHDSTDPGTPPNVVGVFNDLYAPDTSSEQMEMAGIYNLFSVDNVEGVFDFAYRNKFFGTFTQIGDKTTAGALGDYTEIIGNGFELNNSIPASAYIRVRGLSSVIKGAIGNDPLEDIHAIHADIQNLPSSDANNNVFAVYSANGKNYFGGSVGIGTTTPGAKLHVFSNGAAIPSLKVDQLADKAAVAIFPQSNGGNAPGLLIDNIYGDTGKISTTALIKNNGSGPTLTLNTTGTGYGLIVDGGNVGIGTTSPGSYKLKVNGTLYATELWYGTGPTKASDYVFESNYNLESIEEHADYMWKNKHLKAIPSPKKDRDGNEVIEIGRDRRAILEELEKAHIYIAELNERIKALEAKLDKRSAVYGK